MTTWKDWLKFRAARLEAVAQQKTTPLPAGQVQAEAAANLRSVEPACEFCPPALGAAGCAVCRVLDGVTEAEQLTA